MSFGLRASPPKDDPTGEIAEFLFLTVNTIDTHMRAAFRKLGLPRVLSSTSTARLLARNEGADQTAAERDGEVPVVVVLTD